MNKVEDSGVPCVTHVEKKQNQVPEVGLPVFMVFTAAAHTAAVRP